VYAVPGVDQAQHAHLFQPSLITWVILPSQQEFRELFAAPTITPTVHPL